MTVPPFVKSCTVKLVLPAALLSAAIIRPSFLSIGYVVFALLSAVLPPVRKSLALPKVIGTFVTINFLFCLAVALGIGSYQISEQFVHKNDRTYICNRSDTTLFRSIGLVRFHPTGTFDSTRAFLPEIIALSASLLTFILVMFLSHRDEQLDVVGDVVTVRSESGREQRRQRKMAAIMWSAIGNSLRRLTNFVLFLFTAYVGIVKPSATNFTYFVAFLFISTWWATYTPLRHGVYNQIKKFLIFYSAIHFLALYTYQIPIVHNDWLPTGSFISRLFGLTTLMDSTCPDWWKFPFVAPDFNDDDVIMKWPVYANPIIVLIFYYITVAQYKFTRNGSRQYIDDNDYGSSVHEERFVSSSGTVETNVDDGIVGQLISISESSAAPSGRGRGNTLPFPDESNVTLLSDASSQNEDEARSRSSQRNGEGQNSIPLRKVTSQVVDRNKLSNIFNKPGEQESAASKGMIAVMTFVIFHAYSIALAAMMTWALLYHSIFGLVLLILTCILWIFRDTRKSSFTMAPLILIYCEFLLVLQYFLSMDIHQEIGDPAWMDFVGIKWATIPVHALIILSVQTLLSLPVFLLLRLARREKYYESLTDFERQRRINSYGTFGASKTGAGGVAVAKDPKSRKFAAFVEYLSNKVSIYFIFLVSFVLLMVATHFKPNLYNIFFFALWALNLIYLKFSFRLYRGLAYAFWLTLTFYTSIVIIALYIYQFPGVSQWIIENTSLSKKWLDAIGLVDYSAIGESGALFLQLFAPIALFVVTMLQLKFFHGPWSRATSPRRAEDNPPTESAVASTSESGRADAGRDTLVKKLHTLANQTIELLWRFFEVHISKIVFIIIGCFIAWNINAIYIPLVILLSLAICLPSAADGIFSLFMCAYLFLVALSKMIYQLDVVPELSKIDRGIGADNCSFGNKSMADWFGLMKEGHSEPIYMLFGVICSIIALAFQSIVVYRQRHHRTALGLPESLRGKVFPDFYPQHYDRSLRHAIMFLVDYGFYKFGFEITLIAMSIDVWVRMDALAAIQCVWIMLFALNKRVFNRRVWIFYVIYMSILYPLQYILYVGLPPDSCIEYPWYNWLSSYPAAVNHNLLIILNLPIYGEKWRPALLIWDFFLLLLASCQLAVFRKEGQDNESIYSDGHFVIKHENPHHDFIDTKKSYVDYFKSFIFHYGHWITLMATLAAGIAGTSLFALGYIIFTLTMLWSGNNLYVMNARLRSFEQTLKRWNILLGYNLLTITLKVCVQIFGCVFLQWFNKAGAAGKTLCILRQLFSVSCVNSECKEIPGLTDFTMKCEVDQKESKIGYDIVALGFILFQIRILHSWYFQHCMVEYRSEVILANRGAVLKNQLIEKEMKEQNEQQKAKFIDIQRRTEAIRERYQKQIERGSAERDFEPKTYGQAKRAGDYYMFKYDPENDDLVEPVDSFVPEMDPKATAYDRLDPGQIMYAATAHDLDLAKTVQQVKKGDTIKDADDRALTAVSEPEARKKGGTDQPDGDNKQDDEDNKDSKVESTAKFVQKMIASALDLCSVTLNKLCREHRYVGFVLSKEKQKLKAGHSESLSNTSRKLTEIRTDVDLPSLQLVHSENDVEKMENAVSIDWQQKSSATRLLNAVVNCIGAHTDILCYFCAVMTQAVTGGLITMPLPLMSLFWGNLSNPRPSKFFWVTMITYTEIVIVVKFICQFQFMPFNSKSWVTEHQMNPMSMEKLFGVSQITNFAVWDIILLFSLFFHRYMLRKLGLWKDANLTETFAKDDTTESRSPAGSDAGTPRKKKAEPKVVVTQADPQEGTSGGEIVIPSDPDAIVLEEIVDNMEGSPPEAPRGPIGRFIHQLFHPKFRYIRDLYPIMFAIDVVCFLIMTFGYSSFGEGGSGNVLDDVKASRIPVTLVVMLVGMTLAIIVDRALYLRKSVVGKLIYQFFMIAFLHIWIFLVLPNMTRRSAVANKVAQALYVIKSCYFLVSAWQIRNGYPELCIGNLLTHSYGMTNMIAFKVFMNIPFLFELRTAIDWTWTDTSMPLFDFFNMENFYAHIFNIKCARQFEAAYPAPRGIAKGKLVKYMMGFPIIIGVVVFIFSPLLLWSLLNQIGTISMPEKVNLKISIEGYPPLYEMEAQGRNHDNKELSLITNNQLGEMNNALTVMYKPTEEDSVTRSRQSVSYLKGYTFEDILIVRFRPESEIYWPISQDSRDAMIDKLNSTTTSVNFEVSLEFTRPYDPNENTALKHSKSWLVPIDQDDKVRSEIRAALRGEPGHPILIRASMPAFIQVPNQGELILPTSIGTSITRDGKVTVNTTGMTPTQVSQAWFDTLTLNLEQGNGMNEKIWIASSEHPVPSDVWVPSENTTYSKRPYLQTVGFIDRAFPSLLAKVFKGGVIAVYLSVILVVGRGIVRGVFTTSPSTVMFTELPNADHLLKICLDIYLVREAKDFMLEQDLFAKLIFLFRSPATLIEWTRMSKKKQE